jgi:hypothetical protein
MRGPGKPGPFALEQALKAAITLMGLLLLAAPAGAQPADQPMALYGVRVDKTGVTFRAPMSGCAVRSDYTVAVLKRQPQDMLLLSPRRAGQCPPSGPGHIDLTYGFDDLGLQPGQPFVLGNPLASEPSAP